MGSQETSLLLYQDGMVATMMYHLTLVRMTIIKGSTNSKILEVWRKGTPYTVGGNVNRCSHYEEEYGGSLKD